MIVITMNRNKKCAADIQIDLSDSHLVLLAEAFIIRTRIMMVMVKNSTDEMRRKYGPWDELDGRLANSLIILLFCG